MIQNAKLFKNLVMELKNANPNSCNAIIKKNLHPMFLFYFISKILKIGFIKQLQNLL